MDDSIVKHVRVCKLSRKVKKCKVNVTNFSGAKVMCMEDYVQPKLKIMSTHIILHVLMNDVPTPNSHPPPTKKKRKERKKERQYKK